MAILSLWKRLLADQCLDPNDSVKRLAAIRSPGLILAALSVFISSQLLAAQTDRLTESEIKAGFLFNFTRFVEWPQGAFAGSSAPIVLGIIGENPFGELLTEAAAGKTVNGRAVLVRQFKEGQDLRGCQILFVASTDKKYVALTLGKLRGSTVLTVGEGSSFTQTGGMIGFVIEGNKVKLEIDLAAVATAHLKISAKVIAVARLVAFQPRESN